MFVYIEVIMYISVCVFFLKINVIDCCVFKLLKLESKELVWDKRSVIDFVCDCVIDENMSEFFVKWNEYL